MFATTTVRVGRGVVAPRCCCVQPRFAETGERVKEVFFRKIIPLPSFRSRSHLLTGHSHGATTNQVPFPLSLSRLVVLFSPKALSGGEVKKEKRK